MITHTAHSGVFGVAHRTWSYGTATAAHAAGAAAAIAAQRKRRTNAAPTLPSVDRSFI